MTNAQGARLVFAAPRLLVDTAMTLLQVVLRGFERMRWRGHWLRLFGRLRHLAYWRGVADALGGWAAYQQFCESAPPPPRCTLDVTRGLPKRLPALWTHGPCEVVVTARGATIGTFALLPPLLGLSRRDVADQILRRFQSNLLSALRPSSHRPTDRARLKRRR